MLRWNTLSVKGAHLLSVDELEDYLELRDPKVNKQITQSKKDYDAGRFGSARALLAELKNTRIAKEKRIVTPLNI